jgi:hypothetical protein
VRCRTPNRGDLELERRGLVRGVGGSVGVGVGAPGDPDGWAELQATKRVNE